MNIAALKRAVAASADWRGSLVGDPDPTTLDQFDLEIAKQRKAVANAVRMRAVLKKILAEVAWHRFTSATLQEARLLLGPKTSCSKTPTKTKGTT